MSNLVSLPKMSERESTNRWCDKNARLQSFMIHIGGYILRRGREKFLLEHFSLPITSGMVKNAYRHWGTACNLLI